MKALVIDDEHRVLSEIVRRLERTSAPDGNLYQVTGLASHEEALRLLADQRYDVVVTDMVMGPTGKEGIDVLEVVRRLRSKSPVTIVVTAWPKFPVCVEAMHLGAWDYLEKQPADGSDFYDNLLKSIEAAWEYRRKFPDAGRIHPDMVWTEEHYSELAETYAGKYVAVLDQKVVDSDDDYEALTTRLTSNYPLANPAIISLAPQIEKGEERI